MAAETSPTSPDDPSRDQTPPSRPARAWVKGVQWLFAIVVFAFVVRGFYTQWSQTGNRLSSLTIAWPPVLLASAIVLAVYALLIQAWRRMLAEWDTMLAYGTAARIWFAAGLGKYVPGYVWSLTAMGVMARERGASAVAAAGSSLVINLLTIASGAAVALVCGTRLIPNVPLAIVVFIGIVTAATGAPYALPYAGRLAARVTGRVVVVPQISPRLVWLLLAWTAIAWVGYGIAYQLFAIGLLHQAGNHDTVVNAPLLFIAVYTASYIAGLIAPTPGGLGVRETLLYEGIKNLHLMSGPDALILAFASRLWLTVLEVVPGVVALAIHQFSHRTRSA